MLFTEKRVLEFNKGALRALMRGFYHSSENAQTLHGNISDYARDEKRHTEAHRIRKQEEADRRNWEKEFSGDLRWQPISRREVEAQAKEAFAIALRDQTEIFFSRLVTFVQDQFVRHRQGKASIFSDEALKGATSKELINQLKDPGLRQEILIRYFPGRPYYTSRHSADMTAAKTLLAPFQKAQQPAPPSQPIEVPGLLASNVYEVDFSQTPPAPEGPQPPAIRVA